MTDFHDAGLMWLPLAILGAAALVGVLVGFVLGRLTA